MMQSILNNWNFMRAIRLIAGIAIFIQAIIQKDMLFGFAGLVFAAMAVFNTGCCTVHSCTATPVKKTTDKKEVVFEEVV